MPYFSHTCSRSQTVHRVQCSWDRPACAYKTAPPPCQGHRHIARHHGSAPRPPPAHLAPLGVPAHSALAQRGRQVGLRVHHNLCVVGSRWQGQWQVPAVRGGVVDRASRRQPQAMAAGQAGRRERAPQAIQPAGAHLGCRQRDAQGDHLGVVPSCLVHLPAGGRAQGRRKGRDDWAGGVGEVVATCPTCALHPTCNAPAGCSPEKPPTHPIPSHPHSALNLNPTPSPPTASPTPPTAHCHSPLSAARRACGRSRGRAAGCRP